MFQEIPPMEAKMQRKFYFLFQAMFPLLLIDRNETCIVCSACEKSLSYEFQGNTSNGSRDTDEKVL